ncbi:hypothetical protein DBW_0085 [Desulfuromonas sp. DDH964]|uniref:porin n=1 Tax=Desulfuromonas sp. DDH964 TaxID=1823759 RepID=UPI00078DC2F7|nr:porin [Desulfuromonas sp. DDH964]AMV70486.1 hypothetical protein DBW_0085 [Desulfuromonas sp. DDH964]
MKRGFLPLCFLVSLTLFPTPRTEARTLEDILREKGVISAEDYAEATRQSSPAWYQPGKGLSVATADGAYRLQFGGWAQLLYSYRDADRANGENISDFRIRRVKLVLQGNLFDQRLGYKYQADVASGFVTEDVFLNYAFAAPLVVQVGQFKPPQARQELVSVARQLFIDRSLANETFNLGRDTGLQMAGAVHEKLVEYRSSVRLRSCIGSEVQVNDIGRP